MTWWMQIIVITWAAGTVLFGFYLKALAEAFGGKAPWQLWVVAVTWPVFALRAAIACLLGFRQQ